MLLIDWNREEQIEYATNKIVHYPNVVTLSQIYSMMCQRYIEDGITTDVTINNPPDGLSTEIPLEAVTMRKSLDTAVGRASIRMSTKPPVATTALPDILQDTQDTKTKESWKEFIATCCSLLKILGDHYCNGLIRS